MRGDAGAGPRPAQGNAPQEMGAALKATLTNAGDRG